MSVVNECENCGKTVSGNSIIETDDAFRQFWLCSSECMSQYYEKETIADAENAEFSALCSEAIAKGEAESERTFAEAGDGLINSWIDKYAYGDNTAPDK